MRLDTGMHAFRARPHARTHRQAGRQAGRREQARMHGTHALLEVAVEQERVGAARVAQHMHIQGDGAVGVVEVVDGLGRAAQPGAHVVDVGKRSCFV